MSLEVTSVINIYDANDVALKCPHCGVSGIFTGVGVKDAVWLDHMTSDGPAMAEVGIRKCPNSSCNGIVFLELMSGSVYDVYPRGVIDFDLNNLPAPIIASLKEAILCHSAGCYRASALMVRRVLEELCEDKGAGGGNLMLKLRALSAMIVVPSELMDAANELRLLGNDAAHIEAKTYDAIEEEEIVVAIDLTKELLKAAYQYGSLVDRLKALKKSH